VIRSRDATAHFNEIVRPPTRFFVKISAACPIAGHARRACAAPSRRIAGAPSSRAPTIIERATAHARTQAFNGESIVSVCFRLWKSAHGARMFGPREPRAKTVRGAVREVVREQPLNQSASGLQSGLQNRPRSRARERSRNPPPPLFKRRLSDPVV
jgi:hypothetical protein